MHEEYNLEDDQTAMVKEYVNDLIKGSIRELTGDTSESLQYLEPQNIQEPAQEAVQEEAKQLDESLGTLKILKT